MNKISFSLPSDSGETLSLEEVLKSYKAVVLYFYPKDNTPGCSKESVEFSGLIKEFEEKKVKIIGISMDDINSHRAFKKQKELAIDLISDLDGKVCEQHDVLKEKQMFGKKYKGIERSTFVIDQEMNIIKEWRKVKVEGHVRSVLNFIKSYF